MLALLRNRAQRGPKPGSKVVRTRNQFANTPATRSHNMSRIRSSNNKTTELRMIEILRGSRIAGWRRHAALPGKPDFIFAAGRVAVFVDGCFWHGCPRCYQRPRSNAYYWEQKIAANRARDRRVRRSLRAAGWIVISFWEHALSPPANVATRIRRAFDRREHPGALRLRIPLKMTADSDRT